MRMIAVCAVLAAAMTGPTAEAQDIPAATERMNDYLDRFSDSVGPGYAVVIVTADDVLINRAEGLRQAANGAPLTSDTPMYIASQTKAYVGLLGAVLDERGILPLDTPIDTYWPQVRWPDSMDPADYTLRDLLTHQVPFRNTLITFLEANIMNIAMEDYPELMSLAATPRDPGFRYDNIGYNVYAAILETATGRNWRDWLDEIVFEPLQLEHTSTRTSDFGLEELSWGHLWLGEENGWYDVQPKTDGMMQSAGGIVTSPNDMITWLQLQLRGESPEAGLTLSMLETAQTSYVETGREDAENPYAMPCSGYALGWELCTYQDFDVHIHGGTFTGNRSMMAFVPEEGVGIAVFSNSDNMTGWWTQTAVRMFLHFLSGDPEADQMVSDNIDRYAEITRIYLGWRLEQVAENEADSVWQGWDWSPDAELLSEYAGSYRNASLPINLDLRVSRDGLEATMGGYSASLRPARIDLFGGRSHPLEPFDQVRFERNETGEIIAFDWGGRRFDRRH